MLRVLSVCLSLVLVGVFLIYCDRIAAFLVGLLFSFMNEHLDEPIEMVSFPPYYLLVEVLALLEQHFVIHVLAS